LGFYRFSKKSFFFSILIFYLDVSSSKMIRGNNKNLLWYLKFRDSDHFLRNISRGNVFQVINHFWVRTLFITLEERPEGTYRFRIFHTLLGSNVWIHSSQNRFLRFVCQCIFSCSKAFSMMYPMKTKLSIETKTNLFCRD